MTETGYLPEKWVWTEADFEQMNWHDCKIHAFAVSGENGEFALDIDYILQGVVGENNWVSFWISPATLVFEDVRELEVDFGINHIHIGLDINRAFREQDRWLFDLFGGVGLQVESASFKMYLRQQPIFKSQHILTLQERGGLSFDRTHP